MCCLKTKGTFLDTEASVLGEIEFKATSGKKKCVNMDFTLGTILCPQSSGFLREGLTVPLPPALLSGQNSI